jgi:catechol 2,3-dioxygenase-like lactoylglutathione lyase family enzyme
MHQLSAIHHLALTVGDLKLSGLIYGQLLALLGCRQGESTPRFCAFVGRLPEVLLYKSPSTSHGHTYDRSTPGLHHVCFAADSAALVDEAYKFAIESRLTVLDIPSLYPQYSASYYATYFLDPDGLKVEIAHCPDYVPTALSHR